MSIEAALGVAGWPKALLAPEKQATLLTDAAAFEEAVLAGSHIDDIVVLRGGLGMLGQEDVLPSEILAAAQQQPTVRDFLDALGEEPLRELRGRVYCVQTEECDEFELKATADGAELDSLLDKRRELAAEHAQAEVYLGELRRRAKYRHEADGRWAKTVLRRDVKDWIGLQRTDALPYWDRYDEGVFVGARFGGSPLHVDQVQWSNVGKNFAGAKLLAIWPYGEPSRELFDEHNYRLFAPPVSRAEGCALERCAKVALLQAGDVVLFSGGNAHMALSVSAELSVTAYESFINLHPRNLRAFLDSGSKQQYRQCRTRRSMLEDIKQEVADAACDLLDDIDDGKIDDRLICDRAAAACETLRADEFLRAKIRPSQPSHKRPRPPPPREARSGA